MIFPVMLISGTKTLVNNAPVRISTAEPTGYLFVRLAANFCVPINATFRFIARIPGLAALLAAGTSESWHDFKGLVV